MAVVFSYIQADGFVTMRVVMSHERCTTGFCCFYLLDIVPSFIWRMVG